MGKIDQIRDYLRSNIRIINLVINNFTTSTEDDELSIDINIWSEKQGRKKLVFSKVRKIDIEGDAYGSSVFSSILIEDISDLGWEEITFKILISEDLMAFYCKDVDLLDV